ncbi:MAG: MFS transporter [Clostridia bacterium]|nr:MFS transporter [Clostridia bacterium]
MKLNYKRTLYVGFAFLLICAFWQAYDNIIPIILTNKFGMSQTLSGIIMALDNVLALFLLPLFGSISDRCKSKKGRRTPFIVIGTIIAIISFLALTFADTMQLRNIKDVSDFDSPEALEVLYGFDGGELTSPDGEKFEISDFNKDQWLSFTSDTEEYKDYVVPAREAYAWSVTEANPAPLLLFIVILLASLLSMATFRSPAVALMPDVTPKPLRSKGNAVINLMGSFGGVAVLVLGMVVGTGKIENQLMDYTLYVGIVCAIMLISLVIFICKVREPEFVEDMQRVSAEHGIDESEEENGGSRRLSSGELASLLLILASVILWYLGYNAVTSKYSIYASKILEKDYNLTMIIAQAAAIAAYFPAGIVASRIGRKKTILAGVVLLGAAFGIAGFMSAESPTIAMNILFVLCGIGWATINVNSFPMVVELSRGGNVGKYTGFYYTASMAAQTFTPIFSGFLMDNLGMEILFPYAAVCVALAFVTMLLVRHGDSRPAEARGVLESLGDND